MFEVPTLQQTKHTPLGKSGKRWFSSSIGVGDMLVFQEITLLSQLKHLAKGRNMFPHVLQQ